MKRTERENALSSQIIGRRALVIGGVQLAVVGALGLRMRNLQVEQADQFRLLAEENRINVRLLPPSRGLIFDRNGVALAENVQNYRIVIVREDAGDVDLVLNQLRQVISLTDEDLDRTRAELKRRSAFVPVTIKDRLTWEEVSRVAVNTPTLPGVFAEAGLTRYYPVGRDFAHVVGYVGPVSDYDLSRIDDQDPLLQIPKFQIGKTGVENKLEHDLRGSAGSRRIEVNAVGRIMRELDRTEGLSGTDTQLTVDAGLQSFVQARLHGESAAAVVMDTETGDLLSIASSPVFDPNLFVTGISVPDWQALNENKYRPLASKSVQGTYPPGSTFKMITALAALEAGVITPNDTVRCVGHVNVSRTRFHCWKRGGHGNVDLIKSLKESCDSYYYEISQEVGIDKIAEMARRFGLGVRHDLPMSAIAQGLAPDRAWKAEVRGESWRIGDTVNASIGQGYVLASPLQLAVMTARLATGKDVRPRLIKTRDGREIPPTGGGSLGVNENHLRLIRQAMYETSNTRRGTAFGSRIADEGMQMSGKTGTSQVRRITAEERARGVTKNEDLPWERRDHALFVNFAPSDNPRIAVAVVVEHGGGGSRAAAPIGRDITLRALHGDMPPLEAYPARDRDRIAEEQTRIKELMAAPKGRPTGDRA